MGKAYATRQSVNEADSVPFTGLLPKKPRGPNPLEEEAEALAEWLASRMDTEPRDGNRPLLKTAGPGSGHPLPEDVARRAASRPGRPLDPELRAEFEKRLQRDLSAVRLHDLPVDRELARRLGARAFAAGRDIFLAEPFQSDARSRKLLAHEVIHTVQENSTLVAEEPRHFPDPAAPDRFHASFDRSPSELDPKVAILINLHLKNQGGLLARVGGEIAPEAGASAGPATPDPAWWSNLRATLEGTGVSTLDPEEAAERPAPEAIEDPDFMGPPAPGPPNLTSEVDRAMSRIRDYRGIDLTNDPLQNALAGLLADYLKLNGAYDQAARVVMAFRYSQTAMRLHDVALELLELPGAAGSIRRSADSLWRKFKPSRTMPDDWVVEIRNQLTELLRLAPVDENRERMAAVYLRLLLPFSGSDPEPEAAVEDGSFDLIGESNTLSLNELSIYSRTGLQGTRNQVASKVHNVLASDWSGRSPLANWRGMASYFYNWATQLGTEQDERLQEVQGRVPRRIVRSFQLHLKRGILPAIREEHEFWQRAERRVMGNREGEDPELRARLGEDTYARLFFSEDSFSLARLLGQPREGFPEGIVGELANSLFEYFDLFLRSNPRAAATAAELPAREYRSDSVQLLQDHQMLAENLQHDLRQVILPPVVRLLETARTGDPALAERLAWFATVLQVIVNGLGGLDFSQDTGEAEAESAMEILARRRVQQLEKRRHVARLTGLMAQGALQTAGENDSIGEGDEAGPVRSPQEQAARRIPGAARWQEILQLTDRVQRQEDIQTSLLVLQNRFRESSDSSLQAFDQDLGSEPIRGMEPFTADDLIQLYQRQHWENLAAALLQLAEDSVRREEAGSGEQPGPRGSEDLWLINEAVAQVHDLTNATAPPRRYQSEEPFYSRFAGDPREVFSTLLEADPLFQSFLGRVNERIDEGVHRSVIKPRNGVTTEGEVYAWSVPFPLDLVAGLYGTNLFRGLYTISSEQVEQLTRVAGEDDAPALSLSQLFRQLTQAAAEAPPELPVDPHTFYSTLLGRVRQIERVFQVNLLTGGSAGSARTGILRDEADRSAAARIQLNEAMRQATTADRQVVRRILKEMLDAAIGEPVRHAPAVGRAIRNLESFRQAVRPYNDREVRLQSAALVMELIEEWIEVAGDNHIGSYKRQMYPILREALDTFGDLFTGRPQPDETASGEAALVDIDRHAEGVAWSDPESRAGVIRTIAAHRVELQDTLDAMLASLAPYQWQLGIRGRNLGEGTTDPVGAESPSADDTVAPNLGTLTSNLAQAHPVRTAAKIRSDNPESGEETPLHGREPDFYLLGGSLNARIIRVHNDFVFLPGIGDQARAQRGGHALYQPARLYLNTPADSEEAIRAVTPTITEVPGQDPPVSDNAPNLPLVTVEVRNGEEVLSSFTVHSRDLSGNRNGLSWLASLTHTQSQSDQLESLGSVIEGFGNAMLLAASLYPPAGLAITATEILAFLAQLERDEAFRRELEAIWNDPLEALQSASEAVLDQFTIGNLFDLLLNGNFEADGFMQQASGRSRPRGRSGSMGRILRRVRRIAAVMAVRLEDFQETVQAPVRMVEGSLAEHPRMASFVGWIGEHAEGVTDPEALILQHRILGPLYEAYALYREMGSRRDRSIMQVGAPLPGMASGIQEALDRMARFELPATILPMEMAVQTAAQLAIDAAGRFGGSRGRIVEILGRIVEAGASASGIDQIVYGEIARMISGTVIDPNIYWRRDVLPLLKPPLEGAIQAAAGEISHRLREAPLIGDYFGNDRFPSGPGTLPQEHRAQPLNSAAASSAEVAASEELDTVFDHPRVAELAPDEADAPPPAGEISYASVAGMPDAFFNNLQQPESPESASGAAEPPSPSLTPPGKAGLGGFSPGARSASPTASPSGGPLPPSLRANAERRFGHDFSGVRLHQGPDALRATGRFGADGLTQGNHIYLRPDLNPRSGRGERVFHHELAHVLQKSAPAPSRGPSNSGQDGLRLQAGEERAADRMADRAARNPGGDPVPVEGAHASGLSPSLSGELMETFFRKIASPASSASLAETVERAHRRGRAADASENTRRAAATLWNSIRSRIYGNTALASESHFQGSINRIKAHLQNRLTTLPRQDGSIPAASKVISHLAARREEDPDPPSGNASREAASAESEPTFNARGFLTDLSLYIAGRTGIVLDLGISPTEVARLADNPRAEVSVSVEVKHVELLFVSSLTDEGRALWDTAIRNSWPDGDVDNRRAGLRSVLEHEFGSGAPESTTRGESDSVDTGQGDEHADPRLPHGSFSPLWDTAARDLTLNRAYRNRVETEMHPATLSVDLMPPWQYYVNPNIPLAEPLESPAGQSANPQPVSDRTAARFPSDFSGNADQARKNALFLDTHSELTGGSYHLTQHERNSHHITQYLLGEYFRNRKTFKPFRERQHYPGVEPARVDTVDSISGGAAPIDIASTEAGRGGRMPAILISAYAHQNSELHVTPQADDSSSDTPTQGYAIHRIYQQKLVEATPRDTFEEADTYLRDNPTDPQAAAQLHSAVQQTYRWIWEDQMRADLQNQMPGNEAHFYLRQFRNAEDSGEESSTEENLPERGELAAAIRQRVDADAIPYMIRKMRELGWVLPG